MDEVLKARLVHAAEELFAGTGIFAAYAYGSRVHGNPRPDSDLDVGYYLHGFRNGAALDISDELALAIALGDRVGIEVDLRNLGRAPLEFRGRALVHGEEIYCSDESARVDMEVDLMGRYYDYKDDFERDRQTFFREVAAKGLL